MKNLTLLTLFFFSLFSFAAAQKTAPKTVTDFLYLLPETYFEPYVEEGKPKPDLRAYRKSLIKINDTKNGFLRLEGVAWEGWAEMAIFKKTDGNYVVGISQSGCGPICDSANTFLVYEKGDWRDVTEEVLPTISEAQFDAAYKKHKINEDDDPGIVYELPRLGRTIIVRTDGDRNIELFELTWNGTRFVLKNK